MPYGMGSQYPMSGENFPCGNFRLRLPLQLTLHKYSRNVPDAKNPAYSFRKEISGRERKISAIERFPGISQLEEKFSTNTGGKSSTRNFSAGELYAEP